MRRPTPRSTRTDTLCPYTPLVRSPGQIFHQHAARIDAFHVARWLGMFGIDDRGPCACQCAIGGRKQQGRADHGASKFPRCMRLKRRPVERSEEHTSELQSLMRISYAVFCLKKKTKKKQHTKKSKKLQ